MADIKLSLINQALTVIGEDAVSSITGNGWISTVAIENYEQFVEEEIETGAWAFASKTGTPTLLTAKAPKPLTHQWQIPADVMTLQAVLHCGRVLDGDLYRLDGRTIRTRHDCNISLQYLWRPPEDIWPARFDRIIIQRLEAAFLRSTERHAAADNRDMDTIGKRLVAKHTESGQRKSRSMGPGSIVERRRGRSPYGDYCCPAPAATTTTPTPTPPSGHGIGSDFAIGVSPIGE